MNTLCELTTGLAVPGIFISYRRDDSRHAAGRLLDRLRQTYQPDQLFLDVDHVVPGMDFVEVVLERVEACDAMLVIIGPNWLDARDEDGAHRLDNPHDLVRIEVEAALARNVRVIPVLVDDARIPRDDALPEPMRPLTRRNALRLTHEQWGSDVDRLVKVLRDIVQPSRRRDGSATGVAETARRPRIIPGPIGRKLNEQLGVRAEHALYREDGRWYEHLVRFPGVLFDLHGYIVFNTKHSYESCPQLRHGVQLNVDGGISSIRGYVRDDRIEALLRSRPVS
jgi:hypothetical protein